MARLRKIDITLTNYTVRAIDRDGNVKNVNSSFVGKYSGKEILKIFDTVHSNYVYREVEKIEYIKNHYEVDLWDLYDFCENNAK